MANAQAGVTVPSVVVGVGIGGLFDGIVLHQILQWHHLLSTHAPPDTLTDLKLNTLADGLFHLGAWTCTVAGVFLSWRALRDGAPMRWAALVGGTLAGWGAFNLVEGLIDHHILGVHHVRAGPDQVLYDIGFLVWGAAMLVAGVLLLRGRSPEADSDGAA